MRVIPRSLALSYSKPSTSEETADVPSSMNANLTLGMGAEGEVWEFERIGTEKEKLGVEKELQELECSSS
jgi:hypothetical protein